MQTITATFEQGVFKPEQPLDLPDQSKVRITIEPVFEDEQNKRNQGALAALEELWRHSKPRSEHLTREQLHERR